MRQSSLAQSVIARSLRSQDLGKEAEVSLIVTGQGEIQKLNKAYLGEDRPTDVLSFPMMDEAAKHDFVTAPDGKKHLGDIIVSFPQAVIQADANGHPVEKELSMLIVHGILHLLGYDHAGAAEKKVMFGKQDEILAMIQQEKE